MNKLVGTKVIAEKWKVVPSTVTKWCREGKIEGAEQDSFGSPWRIPENAECPKRKVRYKR